MLKALLDKRRAQDVAVLDAQKEFDAAKVELEAPGISPTPRVRWRAAEADATLLKFQAEANAQKAAVERIRRRQRGGGLLRPLHDDQIARPPHRGNLFGRRSFTQ
jgi:hypothetical protein